MPLACFRALAGGVSRSPVFGADLNMPSVDSPLGPHARCFSVPVSWDLGVSTAYSLDSPDGYYGVAPYGRGLAAMESRHGLASGAVAP